MMKKNTVRNIEKEDTIINNRQAVAYFCYRLLFFIQIMKEDFTEYDIKPKEFINYLRYYGPHFNKKLCEFACSKLKETSQTKEIIESLFQTHNIKLESSIYDIIYFANWCKSILYGSSINDEKHFVLFLKDMFEKEEDLIFNRWLADMARKGIAIEWEEMI